MEDSQMKSKPPAKRTEEDALRELKSNGKWAAGITIFSYMYGDLTVASQLPPDPRQDSWLLMKSPLPTLFISLTYIAAVTWWGPLYMSKRKPVTGLKPIMIAYNAFQVVFSAYLFYQGGIGGWFGGYKLVCQKCDFSYNPGPIRMMHAGYWYLISKFIDFIDTLFFVLHKKYEHISVLHVSHHGLMPASLWFGVRYQPGGHSTLMGFLNSFVHTVMYLYYLLAALGPRVRPYLWWKKYLTTLQMLQFTLVFFHALLLAFVDCDIPAVLLRWLCGYAVMFFVLFADFYIKAYRKRSSKDKGDGLPNICYIGAPVPNGILNGELKTASGSIHNSTQESVTDDVAKRLPNLVPNGIANGLHQRVANGTANGVLKDAASGLSEGVSSQSPAYLQESVRLRSRVGQ